MRKHTTYTTSPNWELGKLGKFNGNWENSLPEMVCCCRCNRSGRCRSCACTKANKPCSSCLPLKLGRCSNAGSDGKSSSSSSHSATIQPPCVSLPKPSDVSSAPTGTSPSGNTSYTVAVSDKSGEPDLNNGQPQCLPANLNNGNGQPQ